MALPHVGRKPERVARHVNHHARALYVQLFHKNLPKGFALGGVGWCSVGKGHIHLRIGKQGIVHHQFLGT